MRAPFRDPVTDPQGYLTIPWQRFFQDISREVEDNTASGIEDYPEVSSTGDGGAAGSIEINKYSTENLSMPVSGKQSNISVDYLQSIEKHTHTENTIAFDSPHASHRQRLRLLDFTAETDMPHKEGRQFYNEGDKSLSYHTETEGVTINIGREMQARAKNVTGGDIINGQVVYPSGSSGDNPEVLLAKADSLSTLRGVGMVTQKTINNNAVGAVTTYGRVKDIDTSAFAEGAVLFVSPTTAGAVTATRPSWPNYAFRVGYVIRSHATEGIIFVFPGREVDVFTTGRVIFANGNGELAEDPDFTWDSVTNTLSVQSASVGNLPTTMAIGYHGI